MVDENKNAIPSLNPVNNDSMVGTFDHVLKKFLQGKVNDMLPCSVLSVSSDRRFVKVQPMIMVVSTLGKNSARAPVAKIPVYTPGGGGFVVSFPIKAGDLGWIKSNDRDISKFMQSLQMSPPNTFRMHAFEDAVFLPSVLASYTINSEDVDSAVFTSVDGSIRIALSASQITITAPNVVIDSNLTVNGDFTATGFMKGSEGVDLTTHKHGGVQPGSGSTGVPEA